MPGTLVWMGLKGPRTSSDASGFGSHKSMWLGAPPLKIMMTDFALPVRSGPMPAACEKPAQRGNNEAPTPRKRLRREKRFAALGAASAS